jgi:hypothetical protein
VQPLENVLVVFVACNVIVAYERVELFEMAKQMKDVGRLGKRFLLS